MRRHPFPRRLPLLVLLVALLVAGPVVAVPPDSPPGPFSKLDPWTVLGRLLPSLAIWSASDAPQEPTADPIDPQQEEPLTPVLSQDDSPDTEAGAEFDPNG